MKRATQILALTLTLLPLLAAAQLGSNNKLTAHVPFEFRVGNKVIPAGDCMVEQMDKGTLVIRNIDTKASVLAAALPEPSQGAPEGYALVFHKYGNRYFLTGIKQAGRTIDRLPESGAEAELRAQNGPATEEVLLASLR